MRSRFMFENPDELEATMKITMAVGEWVKLRDQLVNSHAWPSCDVAQAITALVTDARRTFYKDFDGE